MDVKEILRIIQKRGLTRKLAENIQVGVKTIHTWKAPKGPGPGIHCSILIRNWAKANGILKEENE